MSSRQDSFLVGCIRQGDPSAEADLALRYRERAFYMALVRTRDREAAADLAHEVILAVLLALRKGQLREEANLAAFVHGTARNLINNHLRVLGRRREEPLPEEMTARAGEPDLEDAERSRLVRGALEALRPSDSSILRMTLVDGLKPGDIAERLALSPDVVRARKSRALKKVREQLRKAVTKRGAAATDRVRLR